MPNYIVLGQTIPEQSKKYGVRVCTAGYNLDTSEFVRVYPLSVDYHFSRWQCFEGLPLRRNNKDNREESWRLNINIDDIHTIPWTMYPKSKRTALIEELYQFHYAESIRQLNNERRSLAIIRLNDCEPYFTNQRKTPVDCRQMCMFDDTDYSQLTKVGYKYLPRIKFLDDAGLPHDLMLQSWDAYMHQKNLSNKYGVDSLWEIMKVKRGGNKFALIGNMNHQRNSWLIITLF